MTHCLLATEIHVESDVVLARQRARQIAGLLGFEQQDQTRIATAVSEVARNAYQYAGAARVRFSLALTPRPAFLVEVVDRGPGISDLPAILEGHYRSATGMGVGLVGARRLMDDFHIDSQPGQGTAVRLTKYLPRHANLPRPEQLAELSAELAKSQVEGPVEEVRRQNQELMLALKAERRTQAELELLNRELEETNRGVMVLYNELEEKAEALQRAHEAKSQFFSEMNHEVRTPINSILNLSELLLSDAPPALEDRERALGYIQRSAKQLSVIVDDLLDLAKTEAGKMLVRPERFTVESLFAGLRGMFRPLHTREEVSLIFEEARDLPALHTDEGKVSQILRNFISNALKFTERGRVVVSAAVRGDDVVFSVSDTGVGISPTQQAALFERFVQLDNPRQKRVKGTGLGLSLTRSLSELLGGRVMVDSEAGVGSTFRAVIPRTYRQPALADAPSVAIAPGAPSAGPSALIIDDDEVARYLLRGAMRDTPLRILEAATGLEGLRLARTHKPSVIFLDLRMPEMDGFEVLAALKREPDTQAIPVIVHTSQQLTPAQREQLAQSTLSILDKGVVQQKQGLAALHAALREGGMLAASGG